MARKVWIPLVLVLACAAVVTGYAYTNARHAALDAPRGNRWSQVTADAWLEQDVSVPAGTEVSAILQSSLTTSSAQVGDEFTARTVLPVRVYGRVVIPVGAYVHGHVTLAEPAGGTNDYGRMQLAFDAVSFDGHLYALDGQGPLYVSHDVGGVLGGVVGGTAGGAAKGALVGGATSTAASLSIETAGGSEVLLPAGHLVRFTLVRDVDVAPARAAA